MRGVRGTFVAGTLAVGLSAVAASASATQELSPRDELFAHSEEFRQEVIEVTEGIYVAVGYALGNAILVEGEDGVLIIDTTGRNAARAIKAESTRTMIAQHESAPLPVRSSQIELPFTRTS